MLLAIDAGNTNIVFAVFEGGEPKHVWRIQTDARRTADEYVSWLRPLLQAESIDLSQISSAIVSSVVPDANQNLQYLCDTTFGCPVTFVTDKLISEYIDPTLDSPHEIGADRLVNTVGASQKYGMPAIVLDFGTATTFDVIDEHGRYTGGVIAPGANLSMEALHQAAAQLPRIDIKKIEHVKGRDTVSAIESGIYWGYVGMIEGVLKRLFDEMFGTPTVIATGGLAPLFADEIDMIDYVDQDLTVRGLQQIHESLQGNVIPLKKNYERKNR